MDTKKTAATFTSGPWSYRSEESGNYEVKDEQSRWVARVHFRDGAKDGAASCNARLIAQAPEMAGALASFLEAHADTRSDAERLLLCMAMVARARVILAAVEGK